jgi:ABC-type glycerol-3-phosphate transport system permease component
LASIVIIFPFYWMIRCSIEPTGHLFDLPVRYLPREFSLASYEHLLTRTRFPRWFLNTVVVALLTTFLSVVIAVLAGYSFSRFRFPGRRTLLLVVLTTNMMPRILLVVPYYILLMNLRMLNTFQGLIISYVAFALPFTTWMLAGYFQSIPRELEESAMVDGCTRLAALFRVVIPLAIPGVLATAVFAFLLGWSEFLMARSVTSDETVRLLTVGMAAFKDEVNTDYAMQMAGSVLSVLPVLLLFMFLQKYLVQGLTAGAVKG